MYAQQAAADILALINSRPRTPRKEEIAAIIAKTAETTAAPERFEHENLPEWCRVLDAWLDTDFAQMTDRQMEALCAPVVAVSNRIWVKPARTFADVVMRTVVRRTRRRRVSHAIG